MVLPGPSCLARWIAPAVLSVLILGVLGSMAAWSKVEQGHYLTDLDGEIRKLQPQAAKAATLQGLIAISETRAAQLDVFRRRSKEDLDALNELTKMLNPPTWVNGLQMTRTALVLSGETPQADEADTQNGEVQGSPRRRLVSHPVEKRPSAIQACREERARYGGGSVKC